MERLKPADVRYIVFEGGGGKGFAFLGAVAALEQLNVIVSNQSNKPHGYAGSSAGAITATLLAAGMSSVELESLLTNTNFDQFFDNFSFSTQLGPTIRNNEVPLAEYWWNNNHKEIFLLSEFLQRYAAFRKNYDRGPPLGKGAFALGAALGTRIQDPATRRATFRRLDRDLQKYLPIIKNVLVFFGVSERSYDEHKKAAPLKLILDQPGSYLASLATSGGLFPGMFARDWIDDLISERMVKEAGGKKEDYTFASFSKFVMVFGRQLAITGTNLATGKSEIFSELTTPQLPVCTAVRISMGLPAVFKPVRITFDDLKRMGNSQKELKHPTKGTMPDKKLVGTWIDGGVLNNLPLRVFSSIDSDAEKYTLALQLDIEDLKLPQEIRNMSAETQRKNTTGLLGFLSAMAGTYLGAGEAHITESWKTVDQTIQLPTKGLSTLQFSPPQEAAKKLQEDVNESC